MQGFEKVHPETPGAQTCLGCMGKGYHVVRMPSRYLNGMVNEHPTCPKCNGSGAVMGEAPMRRCQDCALNLDPGYTVYAAFACPMFGRSRVDVELRCVAFKPKGYRREEVSHVG